jgi:hypothetical protein
MNLERHVTDTVAGVRSAAGAIRVMLLRAHSIRLGRRILSQRSATLGGAEGLES